MPPRKRTPSAPKPEETDEQTDEAVAEDKVGGDEAPAEPTAPDEAPDVEDPPADPDEDDDEPERSDIQSGEPCPRCFSGGWAAQADTTGGLGCEHGTWQRNPAN